MDPLVLKNRQILEGLCAKFRVRRLELFGSAAEVSPDRVPTDFDFLVEFEDLQPSDYAAAYFGLLEALTEVLEKPVDLVTISAVHNPYFLRSIESTRTVLYAA